MEQGFHADRVLPLSPSPHLHPCTSPLLAQTLHAKEDEFVDHGCVFYNREVCAVHLVLHILQLPAPAMLQMACRNCPTACV